MQRGKGTEITMKTAAAVGTVAAEAAETAKKMLEAVLLDWVQL